MRRLLILPILLTWCLVAPAQAAPHLSLDLDSGRVLSHQQAFDAWHPASLTKLMTAYTVFRAIESGRLALDDAVTVSANARKAPPSRMGYGRGTVMTVENALRLVVVKSANDVSIALAEAVGGSVPRFAGMMNAEAKRLGMSGSRFVNPHGLHDGRQVTTARDIGLLLRAIHRDYPQYATLFRAPAVLAPQRTKNGRWIERVHYSYNLLLERFRGADGFKTGFVCASGYNFAGSATRAGRRIASIVLGRDSQTSRAVDSARLIEQGFRQPADAGTPISELKPSGSANNRPRNMRSVLCTQQARAARYEPGAGQAVIDSPWLQPRQITEKPIKVSLGGATKRIRNAPLPTFRPAGAAPLRVGEAPDLKPEPVATRTAGVPVPTFRPGG